MQGSGFWQKLERPILCLAPMADVTDAAFRLVIAEQAEVPYVSYTEFVSADGLALAPESGRRKLLKDLEFSEKEHPIVAQFFTSRPENMFKAAKLTLELGFDGVDINMGCPDQSIEKQGAGAALIKNPELAQEIIQAAKEGSQFKLPVSVKTRLGYNQDELESWLPHLLSMEPAAVVLHARTRKEMSKVPARWERIQRAVEIRDKLQSSPKTLILGNGDVQNATEARQKCEETGADGAMLGRAVFGNPFLFANQTARPEVRLRVLMRHIGLFDEKLGQIKNFAVMKKHFKSYLKDMPGSVDLKDAMLEAESAAQAMALVQNFLESYNKS